MSDMKFACPQCQQHIQCEETYCGMEIGCPTCATRIIVPQPVGRTVAASAPALASAPPPVSVAPPPVPPGLNRASIGPRTPPPVPQRPALAAPPKKRGKDGWATDETGVHKLGTYLIGISAVIAALLSWGFLGLTVSPVILCIVVGACGLAGGAINVMGRGPIWAGMLTGLVLGLGSYGMVFLWIENRHKVRGYEVGIACTVGAIPGLLLQKLLQKILVKSG